MLIDSGANVDCKPEMLRQFGVMASIYVEKVMGVKNPRVGLANVGVEDHKEESCSTKLSLCSRSRRSTSSGTLRRVIFPLMRRTSL